MSATAARRGAHGRADAPAIAAADARARCHAPDGTIVGIGVDAVDVARFRRILARHPGFAARFFTGTEQADARRAPDPTESLAARFAAKEAVMKALGTGLGGFALTEVEVRRGTGPGATAGAPSLVLLRLGRRVGGAAGGRALPSLAHPHGRGGRGLRGGGTVRRVLPVLTAEEMRAADAAALSTVSHETLVGRAGTAAGLAALRLLGGAYGRRVTVVAGKGSNGADGRVAAALLGPARGAGHGDRRRATPPPRCPAAIWSSTPPTAPGSAALTTRPRCHPVCRSSPSTSPRAWTPTPAPHPGAPFRATDTVTFAAYKPGLLQGAGVGCSGAVQVVDIGVALPPSRAALIEDADVAANVPRAPPVAQVEHRARHRVGVGGHGGIGHPEHPGRHGGRRRA